MKKNELIIHALVTFFAVIVVVSNILSAKMVTLSMFGLLIPAGLATYPLTFLISDLVTEIFGPRIARRMIYLSLASSLLSFFMIAVALKLPYSPSVENSAFQTTLGFSGIRIFSSLFAFVIAQIFDVQLYAYLSSLSIGKKLWIRSNGSTIFSQLIDTVLIDLIFLYWGLGLDIYLVAKAIFASMIYKSACSFALTPIFYFFVCILRKTTIKESVT